MANDSVLEALEELRTALARNVEVGQTVLDRLDEIVVEREGGRTWTEIVTAEERPLVVEKLSANLERLSSAGSRLRRAQAKALHEEGMTMEQVATFFGVTRQRISALLKDRPTDRRG